MRCCFRRSLTRVSSIQPATSFTGCAMSSAYRSTKASGIPQRPCYHKRKGIVNFHEQHKKQNKNQQIFEEIWGLLDPRSLHWPTKHMIQPIWSNQDQLDQMLSQADNSLFTWDQKQKWQNPCCFWFLMSQNGRNNIGSFHCPSEADAAGRISFGSLTGRWGDQQRQQQLEGVTPSCKL